MKAIYQKSLKSTRKAKVVAVVAEPDIEDLADGVESLDIEPTPVLPPKKKRGRRKKI